MEVHYEEAGWVRYDPTPPDLRARAIPELSLAEQMRELASAIELWWFQRVVGFDRSDQIDAVKRAWLAWKGQDSRSERRRPGQGNALDLDEQAPWREALLLGLSLAALCGLAFWLLRARRPAAGLPREYDRALRLLARHGFERAPNVTARDFARSLHGDLPGPCLDAFHSLTEDYLRGRFGHGSKRPGGAALAQLRDGLRSRRARPRGSAGPRRAA